MFSLSCQVFTTLTKAEGHSCCCPPICKGRAECRRYISICLSNFIMTKNVIFFFNPFVLSETESGYQTLDQIEVAHRSLTTFPREGWLNALCPVRASFCTELRYFGGVSCFILSRAPSRRGKVWLASTCRTSGRFYLACSPFRARGLGDWATSCLLGISWLLRFGPPHTHTVNSPPSHEGTFTG